MIDPALIARLKRWAAQEEHEAAHVTGPNFPPPWGADIIEKHRQRAADLREVVSALSKQKDLIAKVYKAEGWTPSEGERRVARMNAVYDVTANHRTNRYEAVRRAS